MSKTSQCFCIPSNALATRHSKQDCRTGFLIRKTRFFKGFLKVKNSKIRILGFFRLSTCCVTINLIKMIFKYELGFVAFTWPNRCSLDVSTFHCVCGSSSLQTNKQMDADEYLLGKDNNRLRRQGRTYINLLRPTGQDIFLSNWLFSHFTVYTEHRIRVVK